MNITTERGKILIVDDDEYTLDIMKSTMEKEGFRVFAASDGAQALGLAQRENPDIVLLDVMMPNIDGIEVLRQIRTRNLSKYVIMVSGQATKRSAIEAMRSGAYDYLEKPIEKSELMAILNKISEEERVLRELADTKEELLMRTQKLASVGQLTAEVVHEIKNPLVGIKGYVQMLLMNADRDPKENERLKTIEREVVRCEEIIQRFLGFARKSDEERLPTGIHGLIEDTLSLLKPKIYGKNATIEKKFASQLPDCPVQKEQIKQVLLNIILNALQSIDKQGHIVIETRQSADNRSVEVVIRDDGSGITQENLPKIFTPFFTTKPAPEGSGLGLAISRDILKRHQGTILVEGCEGKGAAFTIRLPFHTHERSS